LTGGDPVERYLRAAQESEGAGDLVGATNALRLALAEAPEREDLKAEHRRLHALMMASLASTYEKQARYEEQQGRWANASLSWSRVSEGRPQDAEAAWRAARALVEAGGDLKQAKRLGERAVQLAPEDPVARRVLGRVFLQAGMRLNALRELQTAAKLDPSDEIVKNLLRELK
jgi:tetratricopeptide (TPR) repeat protein